MLMNEYQKLAMRTKGNLDHDKNMMNAVLGLNGESGEVADIVKKASFQGHSLDREKLLKETGDILWYVALMCESLDTDLQTVALMNIAKLMKRYPDGFRAEDSINRNICCMCDKKLREEREIDAQGDLYCIRCYMQMGGDRG